MTKLLSKARTLSDEQLLDCIVTIGGAFKVSREVRLTRAALLSVYEEREGEEAVDVLMESLGM